MCMERIIFEKKKIRNQFLYFNMMIFVFNRCSVFVTADDDLYKKKKLRKRLS